MLPPSDGPLDMKGNMNTLLNIQKLGGYIDVPQNTSSDQVHTIKDLEVIQSNIKNRQRGSHSSFFGLAYISYRDLIVDLNRYT